MNTSKENESHLLSSVKNALRILRSFSIDEPEKRVSDLAAELNLSKSTVSRLLATLASEDFVTKDSETNRYKLGVSVLALSGVVTQNLEIYREAQPHIERSRGQTGRNGPSGCARRNGNFVHSPGGMQISRADSDASGKAKSRALHEFGQGAARLPG